MTKLTAGFASTVCKNDISKNALCSLTLHAKNVIYIQDTTYCVLRTPWNNILHKLLLLFGDRTIAFSSLCHYFCEDLFVTRELTFNNEIVKMKLGITIQFYDSSVRNIF